MSDSNSPADPPEPPQIRFLRRLVTTLTVVLIAGMVIMTGLFIWRLGINGDTPAITLPENIPLPEGETLTGYAQNPDWTVLITTDGDGTQHLHLMRPGGSEIVQSVKIGG